jgi:hypothetical protein
MLVAGWSDEEDGRKEKSKKETLSPARIFPPHTIFEKSINPFCFSSQTNHYCH